MAQYKVPQDVEADDKLLGPFTFRQFIYLMITAGMIAAAVALFQIFPLLALIPLPVVIFFAALALPLKKDQPMETYLAAVVSYHLKPKKRYWNPGQRDSTVIIAAPKKVEAPRTRNISQREAGQRLSFLANLIDTEGYSIRDTNTALQEDFVAEAETAPDILDSYSSPAINEIIDREQSVHRAAIIDQMRGAVELSDALLSQNAAVIQPTTLPITPSTPTSSTSQPNTPSPSASPQAPSSISTNTTTHNTLTANANTTTKTTAKTHPTTHTPNTDDTNNTTTPHHQKNHTSPSKPKPHPTNPDLLELAHNSDYSIETIQKEANRINHRDKNSKDEVYISLH